MLIDLLSINFSLLVINDQKYLNIQFLSFINISWLIISLITKFYKIYRHYNYFKITTLLLSQFSFFILSFFAFFSIFREGEIVDNQTKVLVTILTIITAIRFIIIYALKKYRRLGKNYRKAIILGYDNSTEKIAEMLKNNKELGYKFYGFFSNNETIKTLGDLKEYQSFVLQNEIDEIYCSLSELKNKEVKKVTKFANRNNRVVKLIPNANELYNKNISTQFYGDSMVVLNVKKLPFELPENRFLKRLFDIIFSFFTCVFIISWLYPILWILIKLESKGPAIFKQKREGLNGNEFVCYKFRSMRINKEADKVHATKNDNRVTKIGAFMRKTSLDEIPQFFNVLLGDMSVVGPRPHMNEHSKKFDIEVANYMERKSVKPGITGLAQISGYRGEIKKKSDIINRVRLDIFYIENWSFLLDIKIIMQTFFSVFNGDEKAY